MAPRRSTRLPASRPRPDGSIQSFPLIVSLGLALWLSGCGLSAKRDVPVSAPDVGSGATSPTPPRSPVPCPSGNPPYYEVFGKRYYPLKSSLGYVERGIASWYGADFHGRRTSCGEPYDMYRMTAAHKLLPIPTYCEVTNLENGRKVVVKVNDRGPFYGDRVIDLSYAAAQDLGVAGAGTALVELRAIEPPWVRAAVPAPLPASPDKRSVYLQVGVFSVLENAERMRDQILALVEEGVQIQRSPAAQSARYRVQIGPLAGADAADRVIRTLARFGLHQHHIIVD